MGLTDFKNKKVFIKALVDDPINLWTYTGIVNDIVYMGKDINGTEIYFLEIIDIKGKFIGFSSTQIKFIKEEN